MLRAALALSCLAGCFIFDPPRIRLGSQPDAAVGAACSSYATGFAAALADPGTCVDDDDCTLIGGRGFPTCDCAPSIGSCAGTAIAYNAPQRIDAEYYANQFFDQCGSDTAGCGGDVACICDCAPASGVTCSAGRCVALQENQCLVPPDSYVPDAYVPPDAPSPDAS